LNNKTIYVIYFSWIFSHPLSIQANDCSSGTSQNCGITFSSYNSYTIGESLSVSNVITRSVSSGSVYGIYSNSLEGIGLSISGNISAVTTADSSNAYAIYLLATNSSTTLIAGNLSSTVSDGYAAGLFIQNSDYHSVVLDGDITTSGPDSIYGLSLRNADNNAISMTGLIEATGSGDGAKGVRIKDSNNNTISITGDILTSAASGSSTAIHFSNHSDNNTVTVDGKVSATGTSTSYSVQANNNNDNNIITFKQGSSLIGELKNDGDNNKLVFDLGMSSSYNFGTSGTTNWVVEDTSKPFIRGSIKSMGVADINNEGHLLFQRFNKINSMLSKKQRKFSEDLPKNAYWVDSYYRHESNTTTNNLISSTGGGITVGYNVNQSNLPLDIVLNFEKNHDRYGSNSSQKNENNSLVIGFFFPKFAELLNGSIATKFMVGQSDNDLERVVLNSSLDGTDRELSIGSFDKTYAVIGTQWHRNIMKKSNNNIDLMIGIDLAQSFIEGYTASKYYVLEDRDLTQFQARAQYEISFISNDKKIHTNTRIGLEHTNILIGEKQTYSIEGTKTSFRGDKNNTYLDLLIGSDYFITPESKFFVTANYMISSIDIVGLSGNIGFEANF
jgi:hypothetical protein